MTHLTTATFTLIMSPEYAIFGGQTRRDYYMKLIMDLLFCFLLAAFHSNFGGQENVAGRISLSFPLLLF